MTWLRMMALRTHDGAARHAGSSAQRVIAACALLGSLAAPAQEMAQPLTGVAGDAARGRAVVLDRRLGMCLLCHSGPFPEERLQGNLASDLAGVGQRWSAAQLRQRLVDPRRLNPQTLMPAYFSTEGLNQVAARWRGRTLLEAQQVEDVLAFLLTLRGPTAAP
jgi:sulfur-oxidizing protein SoxX